MKKGERLGDITKGASGVAQEYRYISKEAFHRYYSLYKVASVLKYLCNTASGIESCLTFAGKFYMTEKIHCISSEVLL
jgi:hypothetical protein